MMTYRTLRELAEINWDIFQPSDRTAMTRLFGTDQTQMTTELVMMWGDLLVNIPATGDDTSDLSRLRTLTSYVFNMYLEKYARMSELFAITYAPLENYNMIETGTNNVTGSNGGTSSVTDSGSNREVRNLSTSYTSTGQDETTNSNTVTHNTTDTLTHNTTDITTFGHKVDTTGSSSSTLDNTSTDTVAPFDSDSFFNNSQTTGVSSNSGTDSSNVTNSGHDSTQLTGTDTTAHTGTESTSSSSVTDTTKTDSSTNTGSIDTTNNTQSSTTYSDNKSENTTHSLTRHGNIGVTTAQQMLQSELDIIPKRQLKFEFYSDLKRLILIGIYN